MKGGIAKRIEAVEKLHRARYVSGPYRTKVVRDAAVAAALADPEEAATIRKRMLAEDTGQVPAEMSRRAAILAGFRADT